MRALLRGLATFPPLFVMGLGRTGPASAAPEELGALEQEALEQALAAHGLRVDPMPEGKIVGRVHVVTFDVFSSGDVFFELPLLGPPLKRLKFLHRPTRDWAIRREALLRPGDRYQQALADETGRNLRDPLLSNLVVVVPVQAPEPDRVDLLVITRDLWSLRLNTSFEYQQGYLVSLSTSISENNLFGWRKRAAAVFDMGQGSFAVGPTYVDPNIRGSRFTLRGSAFAVFSRETGQQEGTRASAGLAYPLFSLGSRWGASLGVNHADVVARPLFVGSEVARVDLEGTPEIEDLPWSYRARRFGVGTGAERQFGRRVIQRVSAGYGFSAYRPSFVEGFPEDPALRAAAEAGVRSSGQRVAERFFPPAERISALSIGYSLFTPVYRTYRDLGTFDLREDRQLGPKLSLGLGRAFRALGSDQDFTSLGASASWDFAFGGGIQGLAVGWSGRVLGGHAVDKSVSASIFLASPVLWRVARLVGQAATGVFLDDIRSRPPVFVLGGTSGLRAYQIGELSGDAHFIAHLELRSMALKAKTFRIGALCFYDLGGADTPDVGGGSDLGRAFRSVARLAPHHDLGVGLRLLIPQFQPYVIRADWAFATVGTFDPVTLAARTEAGWPGRISIGFHQVF